VEICGLGRGNNADCLSNRGGKTNHFQSRCPKQIRGTEWFIREEAIVQ
jgi:hypothetical protein